MNVEEVISTFQFIEWNIKNPIVKSNCEMMDISKILHVLDELDICLDIFIIHHKHKSLFVMLKHLVPINMHCNH
jgi:hypothetical protein